MAQREYKINGEGSVTLANESIAGAPLCAIRTHVGRAARGVDPVVIGGGGNYSDLGEESLGVAAAFFEETHPEQWKDKMDVYKDRREGAKSKSSGDKNNW